MKLANISVGNILKANRPAALLLLLPFLLTLTLPQAQAQKVTIKRLNPPGSTYAWASAINSKNKVVGSFSDKVSMHGFIFDGAKYQIVTSPKTTTLTQASGINDSNVVSGTYFGKDQFNHGFFLRNGKFTSYDVKKGFSTYVLGINNAGNFVGYVGNQGDNHAFVNLSGKVTEFRVEGQPTEAYAINNKNQAVGFYVDPDFGHVHGFLRDAKGKITQIDVPGSIQGGWTVCEGINDRGVITGLYDDPSNVMHGFLFKNGKFHTFRLPTVNGINNAGVFVGGFTGKDNKNYGYIATPK